jgi:pimeloyl-ACP methyl ester carboxylesterase
MNLVNRGKVKMMDGIRKIVRNSIIGYYKYKFNLIAVVSPRKAAQAAFNLFCTPYTKRRKQSAPSIFQKGEKLSFTLNEFEINGFRWRPAKETLHKVLICHGFDSSSYRFERYIEELLKQGFEVLAFDAPGHGLTSGKQITLLAYRDMVLEINNRYGAISGIIAHSLGGLGAGLALERMDDHMHKRLVLISPATETTRMITNFFKIIEVSNRVKTAFEKLIEDLGGYASSWYSVSRIIEEIDVPTLWIHDKQDTITPFSDMEHLVDKSLPHIEFEITDGLGHSQYTYDHIAERIISFLATLKQQEIAATKFSASNNL